MKGARLELAAPPSFPPLPSLPSFHLFPLPLPSPPTVVDSSTKVALVGIANRVLSSKRYTKYRAARTPNQFSHSPVLVSTIRRNEKDVFTFLCFSLVASCSLLMVRSSKDPSGNISPISLVRKREPDPFAATLPSFRATASYRTSSS